MTGMMEMDKAKNKTVLRKNHSPIAKWVVIVFSCVGMLLFVVIAVFAPENFNDLKYPWLNPLLGPLGFLRAKNYVQHGWIDFMILYAVVVVYFIPFLDNIYFRSIFLILMVWVWGAVGFCSFLVYDGGF